MVPERPESGLRFPLWKASQPLSSLALTHHHFKVYHLFSIPNTFIFLTYFSTRLGRCNATAATLKRSDRELFLRRGGTSASMVTKRHVEEASRCRVCVGQDNPQVDCVSIDDRFRLQASLHDRQGSTCVRTTVSCSLFVRRWTVRIRS